MTKKRKIRYDRIVLLVLLTILLVIGLYFCVGYLIGLFDNDNKDYNKEDEIPVVNNGIKIDLINYDIYEDKENMLGFNFIVAELEFKDENNIDYDLANLITDETIKLNDINDYLKILNINSYNYNLLNTTLDIKADTNEYKTKIFIPYKNNKDLVIVTDKLSGNSFSINTTVNKKDIDDIKYSSKDDEISTASYSFKISNNYISTMMTHNGESYDSSMLSVYTFDLTVLDIAKDIRITNAYFKQNSTGEMWQALDSSYSSLKIDNILNRDLKVGDNFALFFEVYSNNNEKPAYEGKITLEFNDNSSVTIDTILN